METTTDGASGWRNKEKVRQRKLKRGKRREDRRKYGWNKKRRAENKAEAETKRKALAQAAIVGGDHQAGAKDTGGGDYKFSNDIATAEIDAGGSMKSNQSGGGYNAKNTAAAAKQLMRNQKDGGYMMKRHKFSRNSAHGTSMYKEDGPSIKGVPPGSAAHRRKSNGSTLTSSSKQAPAKTGMKTVDPRSNSLKMTSKSMSAKQGVKTGKTRKIVGENTSKIKKDSRGKDYSLIMEGPMKGDTVRPGKAPRVDNYIQGGDYKVKNMGNQNFKIKGGCLLYTSPSPRDY